MSLSVDPAGAFEGHGRKRLIEEWGTWLRGFEWSHYVHLTSRFDRTPHYLIRKFKEVFQRRLGGRAQRRIEWFVVGERGGSGDWHLHALLAGTESITADDIVSDWDLGIASVRVYDPKRGGAYYVVKGVPGEFSEYDISPKLWSVRRKQDSEPTQLH